jgi:Alkylmercury lyase
MTSTRHHSDAGTAGFMAAWETEIDRQLAARHGWVVLGLTNFGERPLTTTRLAAVLGIPLSEAEALARQYSWPGTRIEDGIITVNPEQAGSPARRHLQIGDRRFGVTGCGPDIFLYAPLVRPWLRLEETCTVTGTAMQIMFTPGGAESVEPGGAVVAMPHPRILDQVPAPCGHLGAAAGNARDAIEDVDASICAQWPLFSSAKAARGLMARYPDSRVFPIRQAWELSFLSKWRDRMSAVLDLGS